MILGLSGFLGVGKSTVAREMHNQHALVHIEALATPIKHAAWVMVGDKPTDAAKNDLVPGFNFTWRYLYRYIGDQMRALDPDIFVKLLEKRLIEAGRAPRASDPIVIDDIRFPNEVNWIRKHGGIVVFLERSTYSLPANADLDHESEEYRFTMDYTVSCNDTEEAAKKLLEMVL